MALSDKERKKIQRDKEDARLKELGCRSIRFDIYKGSEADIKFLMDDGGFGQEFEMFTILVRNAAVQQRERMKVHDLLETSLAKVIAGLS